MKIIHFLCQAWNFGKKSIRSLDKFLQFIIDGEWLYSDADDVFICHKNLHLWGILLLQLRETNASAIN